MACRWYENGISGLARISDDMASSRCKHSRRSLKVLIMRILPVLALFALAVEAEAQDIIIQRVELTPPTTFAGLRGLRGTQPSGPCAFPSVALSVDSLISIALGDSAALALPPDWRTRPLVPEDDEYTHTRLTAPRGSLVRIQRQRNGANGRPYLRYNNFERAEGTTCTLERGQTGAIWSLYLPDPQGTMGALKYGAFGDVITPSGFWYSVTLWTSSAAEQSRLASILTEAMLLPAR